MRHAARPLLAALALALAACKDSPPPAPPPAPPQLSVTLAASGAIIVRGVPDGVWGRGTRLVVQGPPGAGDLALMIVTRAEGDTVTLGALVERTGVKVQGQPIRALAEGERPDLGRYHAALTAREADRVRLSRGRVDGVTAGDRYAVYDVTTERALGWIQVTEVTDTAAWAEIRSGGGRMAAGAEARWTPTPDPVGGGDALTVLVLAFGAEKPTSADDRDAGEAYSRKVAGAMADESHGWPGLRVKSVAGEIVSALGDKAGHAEARAIGRRHKADIVVWGTARCGPEGCVLPRFTVVDPERLAQPERDGAQIPVDHGDMKLPPDAVPPEPLALASALLGELAWRAQRYPDVVFHLDRALNGRAYRGADDLEARGRLSRAAYIVGQWTRSRAEAAALAEDAERRDAPVWAFNAAFELVQLDQAQGDADGARSRARAALDRARALSSRWAEALALSWLGHLAWSRGEPGEALEQLRASVAISRDLDWHAQAAPTMGKIADILYRRGELDEALRIRREEMLPVYDKLGDVRARAVTMGKIADILESRGELNKALRIRRQEQLPIYDKLGDVHSRAVTMGKIADILQSRGELDEVLRIRRQEQLPVYDRLGDVRSRAVTMGRIADILESRGELDEALRIRRQEELPVYDKLGDVRLRAVTMGNIADILYRRGELDEALRIRRQEQLPVYDKLGDVRERAVTMGKIADILYRRGELDEALRIRRQEQLPVYDRLGGVRERAVTMGKIADILQSQGEADEALRIRRQEELPVYERLGERRALLLGRVHLALNLAARGRASDRPEMQALLEQAHADAVAMRLPEAAQIRAIQQRLGFVKTEWAGIGAALDAHADGIRITRVIDGGPAAGHLEADDIITAVDGAALAGATVKAAADRIRGPVGAPIRLTIRRGDAAPRDVTLVRQRLNLGPSAPR